MDCSPPSAPCRCQSPARPRLAWRQESIHDNSPSFACVDTWNKIRITWGFYRAAFPFAVSGFGTLAMKHKCQLPKMIDCPVFSMLIIRLCNNKLIRPALDLVSFLTYCIYRGKLVKGSPTRHFVWQYTVNHGIYTSKILLFSKHHKYNHRLHHTWQDTRDNCWQTILHLGPIDSAAMSDDR